MKNLRRTTCSVQGHGARCEVAHEKDTRYPRTTERRRAMEQEARDNASVTHVRIIDGPVKLDGMTIDGGVSFTMPQQQNFNDMYIAAMAHNAATQHIVLIPNHNLSWQCKECAASSNNPVGIETKDVTPEGGETKPTGAYSRPRDHGGNFPGDLVAKLIVLGERYGVDKVASAADWLHLTQPEDEDETS